MPTAFPEGTEVPVPSGTTRHAGGFAERRDEDE